MRLKYMVSFHGAQNPWRRPWLERERYWANERRAGRLVNRLGYSLTPHLVSSCESCVGWMGTHVKILFPSNCGENVWIQCRLCFISGSISKL